MPPLDNMRHELFAQELAKGQSATAAYIAAGYAEKGATSAASRLSANVKVQARVDELKARAAVQVQLSREWVLEQLVINVALGRSKGQLGASNKAIELLGRELGMFAEGKELAGAHERMTDEQLQEHVVRLVERLRKLGVPLLIDGTKEAA